jgi:predicted  nucleic acid-binding Zn-ribbon protein
VPFQQLLELQAALDNETCESERLRRWLAEEQADSQHAQQKCDSLSLQVESLTEQLANEQDEVKELREALSEVQQARLAAEQQLKQAQAEVAALAAQLAPQQPIKDAKDLCSSLPTPLIDCTSPTAASHANSSSHSSQASSDELAALRQALQASEAERQQLALRVQELQGTVGQHSMDLEMLTSKADFLELGKGALHEQVGPCTSAVGDPQNTALHCTVQHLHDAS